METDKILELTISNLLLLQERLESGIYLLAVTGTAGTQGLWFEPDGTAVLMLNAVLFCPDEGSQNALYATFEVSGDGVIYCTGYRLCTTDSNDAPIANLAQASKVMSRFIESRIVDIREIIRRGAAEEARLIRASLKSDNDERWSYVAHLERFSGVRQQKEVNRGSL